MAELHLTLVTHFVLHVTYSINTTSDNALHEMTTQVSNTDLTVDDCNNYYNMDITMITVRSLLEMHGMTIAIVYRTLYCHYHC